MRLVNRFLLTALFGAAAATASFAQTTGTGTGTTGANNAANSGMNTTTNNTDTFNELVSIPTIGGITSNNARGSGAISNQNPFAATYWNPQYLGMAGASNTTGAAGFGTALYGTTGSGGGIGGRTGGSSSVGTSSGSRSLTSTSSANTANFSSAVSGLGNTGLMSASGGGYGGGTAGRTGSGFGTSGFGGSGFGSTGLGGRSTGLGGIGGFNSNNSAYVVAPSGAQIAYVSRMANAGPAPGPSNGNGPPPIVQTEIRTMFAGSPLFADNKTISASATHEGTVTLTGTVGSVEERKLIEGMTRLTPGVRNIDNKLVVKTGG
jgi:hypothetical protein